jgi:hypothetical protein
MLSQFGAKFDLVPHYVQRWRYKYFVSGHYPWSCLYLKHHPDYFSKRYVSEDRFCPGLHVKPTQMSPIDRASPYLWTDGSSYAFVTSISGHFDHFDNFDAIGVCVVEVESGRV